MLPAVDVKNTVGAFIELTAAGKLAVRISPLDVK